MSRIITSNKVFRILKRLLKQSFDRDISNVAPKSNFKARTVTEENKFELLAETVTPLHRIPYTEQLSLKNEWCNDIFAKLEFKNKTKFIPIIPSPVKEYYRNKDEFVVREGINGDPKTVGFLIGNHDNNKPVCVHPTHLINIRRSHKEIAAVFENYIKTSRYAACHNFRDGGNWRGITVRSNDDGDVMAIAHFHPQNLPQEEINCEAARLRDYFVSECSLTSLYFQACQHTHCTAEEAPFILLSGKPFISERIGEFVFRISPDSFFQVNTAAAIELYKATILHAEVSKMTTVIDVCCGTGTLSILASKMIRGAFGIDSVDGAIRDAKFNCKINKVTNCDFFPVLAEKCLEKILYDHSMATDIAVVLNPGRGGMHPAAIESLCENQFVHKIIYNTCKADNPNTQANFKYLHKYGKFNLTSVVPVDLFPHTSHIEVSVKFKR